MTTAGWRTVRVFISSTFRDMQAERDHLVRFVFPRLREALARRRLHLVDVDLRWGVTSDQNALELCLDEIDRCRPRFLCMLGGRYGWVPPGADASITASEIAYGALEREGRLAYCSFYFRAPAATASVPAPEAGDFREPEGSTAEAALARLKDDVRAAAGVSTGERRLRVHDYACAWDRATRRFVGLEAFGQAVYEDLLDSVDAEFGPVTDAPADEFEDERAAMEAFVEARVDRYVVGSRQPVLDRLRAHAEGRDGTGWLCLVGAAGSGKSALVGRFWREMADRADPASPTARAVIAHFVGASAASAGVRQILRRLCHEVDRSLGAAARSEALPDETDKLRDALRERLERLGAARPALIVIDAINQIEAAHDGPSLRWLPETLPAGVRVVVSALPGPALDALRARRAPPEEVELAPLERADRTAIVDGYLERYRKSLDGAQREALLGKADADRPLYLLTALEELRTLGTYEEISTRIAELPDRIVPLFDWILARLERDDGFRDAERRPIGVAVVRAYAAYLASGRAGMTEAELADLVAPAGGAGPADALGNVAALQRLLRPYLMRRGALVDFFHGQLREAVLARYLADGPARLAAHRDIAAYFQRKADPGGDRTWTANHERALSELPYHQTEGEQWDALYDTLTDLGFLEAKCTYVAAVTTGAGAEARTVYNGVYELQEDYRRALERMPPDPADAAVSPAGA
jgi:telomerase protein component 1